jgi:hypothetical protein
MALLPASEAGALECEGVRMPDQIEVHGTKLILNGLGLRRATIFSVDVYVSGLYLAARTRSVEKVLSVDTAKRLVLHFVRDVSQSDMVDAIEDGIRKNAGDKAEIARKPIEHFRKLIPPLRKGMDLIFTYLPDRGLEVQADKQLLGTFTDNQFAQLFFRVWFGPQPPDHKMKYGMLGGKCE